MDGSFFSYPIPTASKFKMFIARMFGKKIVSIEGTIKVTTYVLLGKAYIEIDNAQL